MRFEWDPKKNDSNSKKHGISFEEAKGLFAPGVEYLVLFDQEHSEAEERFISIGPISLGVVVVVWSEQIEDVIRIISARRATPREEQLFIQHIHGES